MSESEGYFIDDMFEYESDEILEKDAKIALECQNEWNTVYLGYEKCPSCDRWVCENHLSDFDMETCKSCQEKDERDCLGCDSKVHVYDQCPQCGDHYCENCIRNIHLRCEGDA